MTSKEFSSLFTFWLGLPSVYHIRLGMSEDETANYQTQLDNRQTDIYNLNNVLKKYDIEVERGAFSANWRLKILRVSFPLHHLKEVDLRMLYSFLTYDEAVIDKHFSVSSNADDSIIDMQVDIFYDLYNVSIRRECDDKLDKLRCLAIIGNNDNGFADDLYDYVKQNSNR